MRDAQSFDSQLNSNSRIAFPNVTQPIHVQTIILKRQNVQFGCLASYECVEFESRWPLFCKPLQSQAGSQVNLWSRALRCTIPMTLNQIDSLCLKNCRELGLDGRFTTLDESLDLL